MSRAARPHVPQRPRAQPADPRLGEADPGADLLERESAREREHEHLALDRIEVPELRRDTLPLVLATARPATTGLGAGRAPLRREPHAGLETAIERHLDDRWRQIGILLPRGAIRAARGAGERIALAERVEHLAAHAARGVRGEWRTGIVVIAPRRLHQPQDTPGDQILAVRAVAPRVERPPRDRPGEREVRDDAVVARLKIHSPLPGGTVSTGRTRVNKRVTELSTFAGAYFDRYRYPDWLRAHSLAVGALAERLARAHADAGAELDVTTVGLGGYLHDIGKSPLLRGDRRDHNVLGPLILAAEGRPELAELSRRHPVYAPRDPATAPRTLAEKIVYYADRRAGQRVVTLEERIDEQLARSPELAHLRATDLAMAKAIEADVFRGISLRPEELS